MSMKMRHGDSGGRDILFQPVRLPVLVAYWSVLSLPLCAGALIVGLLALAEKESGFAAAVGAVFVPISSLCLWACRLRPLSDVRQNEALAAAALMFLVGGIAMAVPFAVLGLPVWDALLESISGITTTGLTVIEDPGLMPASFLFARSWLQWLGGLTILTVALAFLLRPGEGTRRLREIAQDSGILRQTAFYRARHVLGIYFLLTVAAFTALLLIEGDVLTALIHALSSISTGGFSNHTGGLAHAMQPAALAAIILFSFLGATPFVIYAGMIGPHGVPAAVMSEFRMLCILTVMAIIVIILVLTLHEGQSWMEAARNGAFLAISAQTTTGYSLAPVEALGNLPVVVLLSIMIIGGASGSTAGGIKVFRVQIFLAIINVVTRHLISSPHAVIRFWPSREGFSGSVVGRAVAIAAAYGITCLLSWFVFIAYGQAPLPSLFEIISAISTVGLSMGITGPELPPLLKAVLCADMLLGRLEFLAFLVLFSPRNWLPVRKETS